MLPSAFSFSLAAIVWRVDPVFFRLPLPGGGVLAPHWYGLLFAIAFLAGFYLVRYAYRREGRPVEDVDTLLVYVAVGTLAGARLGHCLFYDPSYYLAHPGAILRIWEGGLASHGGVLGLLAALAVYVRGRPDQPYLWLLDRIAPPAILGGALVRVGNLFNSEIVGTPTDAPWAFVFALRRDLAPVPRHPAQLYEAAAYLVVFAVLWTLYRRLGARTPRGLLLGLFFVLVFAARFGVEFVKLRQAAFGAALPLSMGQLLSLPVLLVGLVLVARALKRPTPEPEASSP